MGLGSAYWNLWYAGVIDSIGDGAFAVALPLVAATLTRDPRLIALVTAATYLPWVLLSLPAGAIVDRCDLATLMWRSQGFQGLIVVGLAVATSLGHLSILLICAAAFLVGAAETVFANASQTILPRMVSQQDLLDANSKQFIGQTVSQSFVGPPVGALLLSVCQALPFLADALSFGLSATMLARLPRFGPAQTTLRKNLAADVKHGLQWLLRHRLLRSVMVVLAVNNFTAQMATATLVLLATRTLRLTAEGYALLLAAIAVGGIVGGFVNRHVVRRLGLNLTLLLSLLGNAVVYLGVAASPNAVLTAVLLGCTGFFMTLWNVVTISLRQRLVPPQLLGRVNSVYRMVGWSLLPLGAAASGLVAAVWGFRAPFFVAGLLRLAILLAFFRNLRATSTSDT